MNSKEPRARTEPSNWTDAQREQYLRELDALAEILLDFYLSRRNNVDANGSPREL